MPLQNLFGDLALDATVAERYGGGKLAVTATVTNAGDTTLFTPAATKRARVYWVTAMQDPSQTAQPLITVKFLPVGVLNPVAGFEIYRGFVIGHWETFTGAVDQPLAVSLDSVGRVAVTVHLKEI